MADQKVQILAVKTELSMAAHSAASMDTRMALHLVQSMDLHLVGQKDMQWVVQWVVPRELTSGYAMDWRMEIQRVGSKVVG